MSVRQPVLLQGIDATNYLVRFLLDPIEAVRRGYNLFGPLVILHSPFQFIKSQKRVVALAVGAEFNQEVLSDSITWRTAHVGPGGPSKSASRRLSIGIFRMQGREHEYHRQLLLPPLRRKNIDARGGQLADLAADEVASWPLNQPIDLWAYSRRMLQVLAIGMLFGNDRARGLPIADLNYRWLTNTWSLRANLCPVNVPGTPFNRMLRSAEALERGILDWVSDAGRDFDSNDFLSILSASPDENGQPRSDSKIAAQIPSLLLASIETCQDALIWTLVLLDQHPQIARELLDELRGRLAGAAPSLDRIADLPLLDAVIKESMRLLPPVPQQFRVAQEDTALAGIPIPRFARVVLSPFLTNRNPDLYPDPHRFKPERWASIDPSIYEYFVFSGGPRICPGIWFGFAAIKVAVATILTRCRVAIAPGAQINYKVRLALTPQGRIPATLHRQDGTFAAAPISGRIRRLVQFPG
jgi:cytochrome P450